MRCPRCQSDLTRVRDVDVCLRCGGAFLAAAATDTVRRALDVDALSTAQMAAAQGGRRVDEGAPAPCPACAQAMRRFRVGPVDVDTCLEHGTWYDRGELGRVRDALLANAPTHEVAVGPAGDAATTSVSSSSGLELAREREHKVPSARPASGAGIDPRVQAKINELAREEQWRARREERFEDGAFGLHRHHHHGGALEIVEDILDILR